MPIRTSETLEERVARVAAEVAEVQAEQQRRAEAEYQRLIEHQAAVDEQLVSEYDRAPYEAAVAEARAAVDRAIAEDPVTKALTAYYEAAARRRTAFDIYIGARGRQGHDVSGVRYPETPEVDVLGQMLRTAQQAGSEVRMALDAEFHDRYSNPERTAQ